jgi:hypothetical protein
VTFAAKRDEMRLGGMEPRARLPERGRGGGRGVSARHAFLHAVGRLHGGQIGRYAHAFLDAEDADYIESFDFFASDWIKTGLKRRAAGLSPLSSTNARTSGCSTA